MSSSFKGLTVPDYNDPPDGPQNFRDFASSLTAGTILGQVGSISKPCPGAAGWNLKNTAWAIWAAAALPQPTTLLASSLVLVRVAIDVSMIGGGDWYGARLTGVPASAAYCYELGNHVAIVCTAMLTAPAGVLTLGLETINANSVGSEVNSLTWNIFATGGIT